MFKLAIPLLALAALAVAGPIEARGASTTSSAPADCSVVSWYIGQYATPSAASAYCSSFLSIQTSTSTVTTTSTASDTSMSTTTTTITSSPIAYDSVTATCTSIASAPSGAGVKRGASITASAPPTYACNACSNLLYPCGFQGSLSSPNVIAQPAGCPDSNTCRSLCWANSNCMSFSFDTSDNCKHYGKSVISQGLSKNQNSPVQIWDRGCFTCTSSSAPPTTTAKSTSTPKTSSNCATPSAPASSIISAACSCLNIKAQTTTSTVTATATTIVATTVFTSTTTSVAPTWTSTVTVAEIPFVSYGQYTAYNGDVYNDYAATDFYGYNYYSGYCGAPDGVVDTPYANYSCQSFDDCQDICSKVNAARQPTDHQCLGISFSTGTPYCYLKYAVPGNGAPDCEVVEDMYNVNSSVLTSCAQAQPLSKKRAVLF